MKLIFEDHSVMTSQDDTNDSNLFEDWSEIDWISVNKEVKNLRSRICNARLNCNFRKLRNLQRLMLNSKSNILFSIKQISSNSGRKTAGIDGIKLKSPSDKLKLFYDISSYGYMGNEPKPSRRVYIKEPKKLRPIGIPTIHDRVIQCMVKNALEPEWEAIFEKGSYGFRPNRNVDDAIFRIWNSLNRPKSRKWIVDTDISKCFDSIHHSYMLEKLKGFPGRNVIQKWLKAGIIVDDIWFDSGHEGTPQGSSISPLLCNIALHGIESELGVKYTIKGYVSSKSRSVIRFADDLVILCWSKEDAEHALEKLKLALKLRGLDVSEEKTRIVHVLEGFDFLGFTFKLKPKRHIPYRNCISVCKPLSEIKILQDKMGIYVQPSRKSIKKIKVKLKEIAKKYSSNMTSIFIRKMNEVIRGYAQSKCHWHSSTTFGKLDNYLFTLCWRWILRRHIGKSKSWLKKNYFKDVCYGNIKNKSVFYAKFKKTDKIFNDNYMFKFSWFRIIRQNFLKIDKLPDNKKHWEYFKELRIKRVRSRPFNILFKLDKDLAESQFGICPICNSDLFNDETLHIHHIIPRSEGGSSTFSNLVIIHQSCHWLLHGKLKKDYYRTLLTNYKLKHARINRKKKKKA